MGFRVPITIKDAERLEELSGRDVELVYPLIYGAGKQSRHRGRIQLGSPVDLQNYEFTALFDWIEIGVTTPGAHQPVNIHNKLDKHWQGRAFSSTFVSGPNREKGHYVGSEFYIKFHDPEPFWLRTCLAWLVKEYRIAVPGPDEVRLSGIEVSLDVYPTRRSDLDDSARALQRMAMTSVLQKHIVVPEAFDKKARRRPRFVFGPDGIASKTELWSEKPGKLDASLRARAHDAGIDPKEASLLLPEAHNSAFPGATLYIGDRDEVVMLRCMDKISDHRLSSDDYESLPPRKRRSRVEFTLQEKRWESPKGPAQVGLATVGDISSKRLRRFNKLLRFARPAFPRDEEDPDKPDERERMIFTRSGFAGLNRAQRVGYRISNGGKEPQTKSPWSMGFGAAFSKINSRVGRALDGLQERWARDWGEG